MGKTENIKWTWDIAPRVYRALRDESDNLCRWCKSLKDDHMTQRIDDGIFIHSNGRECQASAIRRIWKEMLYSQQIDGR
jgi:hypothetical protein